ncbi:hypothetical protein CEF09_12265 [Vibrio cholerae]|nr:hypothetical protein CEF09_12265 [Vibrio cholerae]
MLVNKKRVLQYTQSLASGEPVMSKVCNSHRTRWEMRIKSPEYSGLSSSSSQLSCTALGLTCLLEYPDPTAPTWLELDPIAFRLLLG